MNKLVAYAARADCAKVILIEVIIQKELEQDLQKKGLKDLLQMPR